MRLRLDGATYRGRGVDLRDRRVPPRAVATAVADEGRSAGDDDARTDSSPPPVVAVECSAPGDGHGSFRTVPGTESIRGLLAAAARSRGRAASVADRISAVRRALRELTVPDVDLEAARRRVAEATGEEERFRERVAALRGELRAREDLDGDVDETADAFREATAALSEAETERIAAEQALSRAEERAREARDARDRRLALQDRLGNLRRTARAELALAVYPAFASALEAVPGAAVPGADPGAFEGDRTTAALAALRIADLDAPIVLALEEPRFDSARRAAEVLDVPVVRCRPDP